MHIKHCLPRRKDGKFSPHWKKRKLITRCRVFLRITNWTRSIGKEHKDDWLLTKGHCRSVDRAEWKWQNGNSIAQQPVWIANYFSCVSCIGPAAHSAAKQSWSIHANFNNRFLPPRDCYPLPILSFEYIYHCLKANAFLHGTSPSNETSFFF